LGERPFKKEEPLASLEKKIVPTEFEEKEETTESQVAVEQTPIKDEEE